MKIVVFVPFKQEDEYYKRASVMKDMNPAVDIHLYRDTGCKVSFRNFIEQVKAVQLDDYDFVCLVDIHCVVDYGKYMAYLKTLPTEGVYEGFRSHAWGIDYCPGSGMGFSKNVIDILVESVQDDHYYPDITIGKVLGEHGIKITNRPFSLCTIDTADKIWSYFTEIESYKEAFDRLLFGI
jgi:hypothetical protein